MPWLSRSATLILCWHIVSVLCADFSLPPEGTVYRIGGLAIRGADDLLARFAPTFTQYLTETVGARFNVSFETLPMNFADTFDFVAEKKIDFIYTNPSAASCVESEYGVAPIVTLRNFRQGNPLNQFGGTIFTHISRTDINSIYDLKDKIVEAVSISGLGACQMQWKLMYDKGMNLLIDPIQVRFSKNQKKIVWDVLSGDADVGFVRTDLAEGMGAKGEANYSEVKVIDPISIPGFPFKTTTELYPEWSLAALPHVPAEVGKAVATVLMELNTTHYAAQAGTYSTWDAPISYMPLRAMQESLNWIDIKTGACIRSAQLYDAIVCPSGYFKLPQSVVENQCQAANLPCPEGYECLCRPCFKLQSEQYTLQVERTCQKMTECASAEQLEMVNLTVTDNWYDARGVLGVNYTESILIRVSSSSGEQCLVPSGGVVDCSAPASLVDSVQTSTSARNWTMSIRVPDVGLALVRVIVKGLEIDSSPSILQINTRTCGTNEMAEADGTCVCRDGFETKGDECVKPDPNWTVLIILVVLGVIIAIVITIVFMRYRHYLEVKAWRVDGSELEWPCPPIVLGRGTFGEVLQAQFRGIEVAVKHVLPPEYDEQSREDYDDDFGGTLAAGTVSVTVQGSMKASPSNKRKNTGIWATSTGQLPRQSHTADATVIELGGNDDVNLSVVPTEPAASATSATSATSSARRTTLRATDMMIAGMPSGKRTPRKGVANPLMSSMTTGVESEGYAKLSWRERRKLMKAFYHEMRSLSGLRHPNITTVMGAVMPKKSGPLMIMECMNKGSFYDLLHNPSFDIEAHLLLSILKDVAQGVTFLHGSSVIHNDLKAQNVLLDRNFTAKVSDFGLASTDGVGAVAGTPYWMAPEALRNDVCTNAIDIYSYAIVMYEALSRQEPYKGLDMNYVLKGVMRAKIRPSIKKNAPQDLVAIMKDCWDNEPTKRPTANEIFQRLSKIDEEKLQRDLLETHQANKVQKNTISGLPHRFADAIVNKRDTEHESFDPVTCVFTDIVGYSALSAQLTSEEVVDMLTRLFANFDRILKEESMYCVDIIGDAYMAVSGLMGEGRFVQVEKVSRWAIAAVKVAAETLVCTTKPALGYLRIRAGINTGPCTAGVVGKTNPRFSLFGDTINVSARMESLSRAGCIQMPVHVARVLEEGASDLASGLVLRGQILVKGKGSVLTYWLTFPEGEDPNDFDDHDEAGK